jgi:pyruvate dehydrogenase E1 component alpha subunit
MASIWKLPVLYVCENNWYGMFTPASYALSVQDVSKKAEAYGIPGVTVNGMNVIDVFEATNQAVKRAKKGLGPTLIECKTYRYYEHYGSSTDSFYRTKEEREQWKQRDPIKNFKIRLVNDGVLTEDELYGIDKKIKIEIDEAVKFAEESPNPNPEDALEDLFV